MVATKALESPWRTGVERQQGRQLDRDAKKDAVLLSDAKRRDMRALKGEIDAEFEALIAQGMNEGWIVRGDAHVAAYTVVRALSGIGRCSSSQRWPALGSAPCWCRSAPDRARPSSHMRCSIRARSRSSARPSCWP